MSTIVKMTLIGLYNYDPTLFDNMTLPEEYDKETLIESLLLEHGEKPVLYTDLDFMKFAIGAVSRKWQLELKRIYDALIAEYNPIENYDRYEDFTDTTTRGTTDATSADYTRDLVKGTTETTNADYHNTRDADLKNTSERLTDEETENKVSAFNEGTYSPERKTTIHGGKVQNSETGSDVMHVHGQISEIKNVGTDSEVVKGSLSSTTHTGVDSLSHDAHIHGNIGVTTASAMISESVKMRLDKNLYAIAARIFANELLIQIY